MYEEDCRGESDELSGKAEIREAEFFAAGETYDALFSGTLSFEKENAKMFDSGKFSGERILISTSAIPHHRVWCTP